MPISGPVLHRQLLAAYTDAQSHLEAARFELTSMSGQRSELGENRGETLMQLAEHYLPELSHEAIQSTWREVQPGVTSILLRKQNRQRELTDLLHQRDAVRVAADTELLEINERLDEATQNQDEVSQQVESRLRQDEKFVELSDRAAIAELALERAEANLQEIEQDAARKLPDFENSSLFCYLRDRNFGERTYKHRGFTRRMDRSLAKFINYAEARTSYDFLSQTPVQMRKIIAEDRAALDTVLDELERRRDDVASELGLPACIETVRQLTIQRGEKVAQLETVRGEMQDLQTQLTALEDKRGPYYQDAIRVFREMLENYDTRHLEMRSLETIEITDDQIVAKLMGIDSSIDRLDNEAHARRKKIDAMQDYLTGIGRLIQQFRAARFDSSRSQFIGSWDLYEELSRVREPQDFDDVWSKIRQFQRWGPTAVEQVTAVATHPMTQVLINAMAHAAGAALSEHARNAGNRRTSSRRW